jgi:hypothetical protein
MNDGVKPRSRDGGEKRGAGVSYTMEGNSPLRRIVVKGLGIIAISVLMLFAEGCTSNDKDGAGRKSEVTAPVVATELAVIGGAQPPIASSDPAANGGASLPASAPYEKANGPTVQQNINPAPFMLAGRGQAQGQGSASGAALITSGGLTSRADGTMSGPRDQPAATTGWGTQGPEPIPAATSGKPATQPSQKPPK